MDYEVVQHHGVKGMHWGVITKKVSNSKIGRRIKRNQAARHFYGYDLAYNDANKRYRTRKMKKWGSGLSRKDIAKGRKTIATRRLVINDVALGGAAATAAIQGLAVSALVPFAAPAIATQTVGEIAVAGLLAKYNHDYYGKYSKEYKRTGDIKYHKPEDIN